jgi:hypothetical protein
LFINIRDLDRIPPQFIKAVITFCLLISISAWQADLSHAQEQTVPINVQIPLFLKILTYDNNLMRDDSEVVTIGIIYTQGDRESEDMRDILEKNFGEYADKTLKGYPISYLSLPFVSGTSLQESVKSHEIKVIYVAVTDIRQIKTIIQVSQLMGVLTISGNSAHVQQGVSVVLGLKERKPEIIINLPTSRMEGAEFSAHLLKVCRVMK